MYRMIRFIPLPSAITNNKQPTTNNQQPTTNNQQPTTNNQQPTTNNQQPTTNNQQPTTMKEFFKQTLASIIGTITGLILLIVFGTVGLAFLVGVLAGSKHSEPQVKDKSVLVLDLSLQISDTEPASDFSTALSAEYDNIIPLRQAIAAIDEAAEDSRIVGILLDGRKGGSPNGYANLQEVRSALERFKEKGKKIVAYDVYLTEREYYLATVADTMILNPIGTLELNGLGSEQLFLTGALEKYGIGVQVVRVGNYKSAVEPFTRTSLSQENREQTEALLNNLWDSIITTVGESRQLTLEKLQQLVDSQGFLSAKKAKDSGLIDQVAYWDEAITDLEEITGAELEDKSFRKIGLASYLEVAEGNSKSSGNEIAIVYAEGSIVDGEGGVEEIGGDRFARELRKLRQDNSVKAIVLRVNSPGGSATASDIILREVELTREKKPVIVSMGNVAASGGYWISTGADYIFAEENTITGSIGVFGLFLNIQELGNNNGLTWDVVKTGRFADAQSLSRPKTREELRIYQGFVNEIYELFLDKVATSRELSREEVAKIAQGRVWSGVSGKKIGLVDEIGGLEKAIAHAANEAELGDDWEVEEYPKQRSFQEEIIERLLSAEQQVEAKQLDPLTAQFIKFKQDLRLFQTLNDPKGIYARLPFSLRIE